MFGSLNNMDPTISVLGGEYGNNDWCSCNFNIYLISGLSSNIDTQVIHRNMSGVVPYVINHCMIITKVNLQG